MRRQLTTFPVALVDEEGDKAQVWDSQGSSGYQDLLQERLP